MEDIVRENVREHACHVMIVDADESAPRFAYSIGLTHTFRQPELICFGLSAETLHWLINEFRDRMASGSRFSDGQVLSDVLGDYDVVLRTVHESAYREYFGYARWFYDGAAFDALQIVWPDKERRFPDDAGYALAHIQPAAWLPFRSG